MEGKGRGVHNLQEGFQRKETVHFSLIFASFQVELHDRSLLAGDLVQKSSSNSSCGQLGTVRMVHVTCHLQTLSTKQIIYNVPSTKIEQIAVSKLRN